MGTTGVIFAAIAIAWLAYLVPHFVRRRDDELAVDEVDPAERFAESVRIVRRGTAPLLNQDLGEIGSYEVSTPLTRRAALNDLRRLERVAAARRRRVLVALLALLTVTLATAAAGLTAWWAVAVPGGLVVAFLVVARFSVQVMRRDLDARYAAIRSGSQESTVVLSRRQLVKAATPAEPVAAVAAKVSTTTGALWDPIPVTLPTYVSKPLAPRTVRTIDLSGPAVTATAPQQPPVTADAPAVASAMEPVEAEVESPRAASA